jgi:predicted Zn-dependent peptidase
MAYDYYKLNNGVRVVMCPMEGVESLAVGTYVETGSRYETPKINGISHFLEHMVFKGTNKFPTPKDTSYLEGLGAIQNAWTDVDATAFWCKIPADKWKEGLEMVKELALYPTIPVRDLEIERGVILEEVNRTEDRPDELSGIELMELMYSGNGLGMSTLGTKKAIKNVSREDFVAYHDSQYVAERLVVAVAGKIPSPKSQVTNQIQEWFGSLPKKRGYDFVPVDLKQEKPVIKVKKKDLAAQVHIQLGVPALTVSDPRRFALTLLTAYLGSGLSSRLFIELREKRGLCYTVSAGESRLTDTGVWSVYAGLNIDKTEDAVKAIAAEMQRMKEVKLTEEELAAAKEKNRGPILFSAENPVNVMNFYAKQILDRPEEVMTYDQVIDRLMLIDVDEIQQVARDLFVTDKLNLAMVGPVEEERALKIKALLKV